MYTVHIYYVYLYSTYILCVSIHVYKYFERKTYRGGVNKSNLVINKERVVINYLWFHLFCETQLELRGY